MRRSWVKLLTVVAILVIVGAVDIPGSADQHGTPTKRFLRDHQSTKADEERAVGTSSVNTLLKSSLSDQRIEELLKKGSSADDVFKLLKLNKAENGLFDNPELKSWINYMKLFNKQNPTKKTSLVATLTAHYGDEGLAKMIEAAKLAPSTATFAKRLETEQIQRWLALKKFPDAVFKLIKLHKAGSKFFDKPKLNIWVKYVDEFNKENPTLTKTLITRLAQQYNDKTLTNMLIAAQKKTNTKNIATRIQSEQTLLWLKDGKKPEDLFTLLELNKAGNTLFENPLFTAWIKYADDFRSVHRDTELATFSTLMQHYDDDALAGMIMAAGKVPETKNMAGRLLSEQQRYWFFKRETPDDIYMLLRLSSSQDKLLENPLFVVWVKYLTHYNEMNLKTKWSVLKSLTQRFGDGGLSDMLMAATKVPDMKSYAKGLQKVQLETWLDGGKSPKEVYKLLRVEGAAADDASSLLYKKYLRNVQNRLMQQR